MTSYTLSFANNTERNNRFFSIDNPETGSNLFTGVTGLNDPVKPSYFTPVLVSSLRIYPRTWFTSLALRWEVMFCDRMYNFDILCILICPYSHQFTLYETVTLTKCLLKLCITLFFYNLTKLRPKVQVMRKKNLDV